MIKDKKRVKEQNKKLERNQVRLNKVLDLLGVSALHKTLYRPIRDHLVKYPDPPLFFEYEGSKPLSDNLKDTIGWWVTLKYKGMSSEDFIEVLRPLIRVILSMQNEDALANPTEFGSCKLDKEFIDQYWKPAQEYLDFFQKEFRNLFLFLIWKGVSVDNQYIQANLEWDRISNSRIRTWIRIKTTPSQSSHFAGRWNYRVGCRVKDTGEESGDGVRWLSQSPVALGLPGREDEWLPVYISRHALDRLDERLDCAEIRLLITPCLYTSLSKPGVHPLRNVEETGDSLVEMRLMNTPTKVGYFVVSRTENEIYIKTFLFLTMGHTPEGNLLHRRLRMARPDFDFHNLEKYSTFKATDIATHPTLVPIWEQCGFTDFLKWVRTGHNPRSVVQLMGDDMVKYFRL